MPRNSIDFDGLKRELLADARTLVANWCPGGKMIQRDYVPLNPTRADKKPGSFRINVHTGHWADFATGDKGGDLISLYAYLHKISQVDAAERLRANVPASPVTHTAPPKPARPKPRQIIPAPAENPPPDHKEHGPASNTWTYRTQTGELIGYVCRFNTPEGKEYSIWAYFEDGWRWRSFSTPRPLYGLETLDDRPVILTEGEKAADAGRTLFPSHAVLAWPGGTNAVEYVDFSPLEGRSVTLWPDNDEPGFKAMAHVAKVLEGRATVRTVPLPPNVPLGWDLADAVWTPEQAAIFFRAAFSETEPEPTMPDYEPQSEPAMIESNPHFTPLGHDRGTFYYHCTASQQIVEMTATTHSEANLRAMAPGRYWEVECPTSKIGADYKLAAERLINQCYAVGIFDKNRIRGRGAWFDNGRCVLNLGDRVFIAGKTYAPSDVPSKNLYEAGQPLKADLSSPLTPSEAKRFEALIEMQPWERPIYARFLAGWCVCAHIGGVLTWRPHIWMTGKRGSGKSWVMSKIVNRILGGNCLFVVGDTTEAGIRHDLGSDSIPVMFDEAEGANARDVTRLQSVLGLVRQSSSETGGKIAKGGANGKGIKYEIRSCFAFSSINSSLMQESDRSRVSLLELDQTRARYDFKTVREAQAELLTDDYVRRFYARAIELAEVIRANAITFADAVAVELGEQRAGDQIGALLAGAYSLSKNGVITLEGARQWVQAQDWSLDRQEVTAQSDEKNLWDHLMGQRLKFRPNTQGAFADVPIGVLIEHAHGGNEFDVNYPSEVCREALKWAGFLVQGDALMISNKSPDITRMLANTPWSQNYGRVLKRLPGAEATPAAVSFGSKHSQARATRVPL